MRAALPDALASVGPLHPGEGAAVDAESASLGREFVGKLVGGGGESEAPEQRRRRVEEGLRSFVLSGHWVRERGVRLNGEEEDGGGGVDGASASAAWQKLPSVVSWSLVRGEGRRGVGGSEEGAGSVVSPAAVRREGVKRAWEEGGIGAMGGVGRAGAVCGGAGGAEGRGGGSAVEEGQDEADAVARDET